MEDEISEISYMSYEIPYRYPGILLIFANILSGKDTFQNRNITFPIRIEASAPGTKCRF